MFDPEKRLTIGEINNQASTLFQSGLLTPLLREIPQILMVLNGARQIIFVNKDLNQELRLLTDEAVIGARPGESLGCIRAQHAPAGCGSTKFCSACGFADALARSENGERGENECHILVQNGESLDFQVSTAPIDFQGERYIFCIIQEIGETKTKAVLERIFLHDLQNTAATLYSIRELFDELSHEELKEIVYEEAEKLMDEIQSYRLMIHAETRELVVEPETISVSDLVSDIVGSLRIMHDFRDQQVVLDLQDTMTITTDKTLLNRVLKNLLKNAFEAEKNRATVTVKVCGAGGSPGAGVLFSISNPTVIPDHIQANIFKKKETTKGLGRGWGSYSVRLLTEAYLRGRVEFRSTPDEGTIFEVLVPDLDAETVIKEKQPTAQRSV